MPGVKGSVNGMKGSGRGLTKERRLSALRIYSQTGIYARVYEGLGIDHETFRRWRIKHPDFQEELDEAGRQFDLRIGHLARHRVEEHLEQVGTMVVVEERDTISNQGVRFTEVRRQRVQLNPGLVRMALTKLDPAWVKPPEDKDAADPLAQALESVAQAIGTEPRLKAVK